MKTSFSKPYNLKENNKNNWKYKPGLEHGYTAWCNIYLKTTINKLTQFLNHIIILNTIKFKVIIFWYFKSDILNIFFVFLAFLKAQLLNQKFKVLKY